MIKAVVFSKNRPMQLHCFLESLKKHNAGSFDGFDLEVIAKFDKDYQLAYEMVNGRFPEVSIYEQGCFFSDTISSLDHDLPFHAFFVDDDIFFRDISHHKWNQRSFITNDCYSFRLGQNIRHKVHFNYPLSVDGNVFKTEKIQEICQQLTPVSNPNKFESALQKFNSEVKGGIYYEKHSSLVGVPVNRVSDTSGCSFGENHSYSEKELLEKYMDGYVIDLDNINFGKVTNVHKEIELKFKRYNG